jgi:hypothetical protein
MGNIDCLGTLMIGAVIGSMIHWPSDHQNIKIIGDDLEFIGEEGGAYKYKVKCITQKIHLMET